MRIGILTFHSEINYGSVLQALALQTHLESLDHEVVIIDKWEEGDNRRLVGPFGRFQPKKWFQLVYRGLWLSGDFARLRRRFKTIRFIRRYLKRTPYHFHRWANAPKDLGVDLIVVGSDQVWNPDIVPPVDYLLKDVPGDIPGIAYAASIGKHELARRWWDEYVAGFQRFKAIGVREAEAKTLVESTGAKATHVVDPTLLVDPNVCWTRFAVRQMPRRRRLFAYLMTMRIQDVLTHLKKFAEEEDADVELFLDSQVVGSPHGFTDLKRWAKTQWQVLDASHVHLRLSAAPDEFVREVSAATWVVTESFHGMMFSTIFRKNVRIVLNDQCVGRSGMSARLTEFAGPIIRGRLMCSSLSEALMSLRTDAPVDYDEQALAGRINASQTWLQAAIATARRKLI